MRSVLDNGLTWLYEPMHHSPVVAVQGITTAAVPGSGSQQGGGFIVNMGRLMSR